jgi:hypothetical protein
MGQVGWRPCICAPAREAGERGRGLGHLWVSCNACRDHSRRTTFYEPPHDVRGSALARRVMGELGVTPRDLRETLVDTVKWLTEQGHLPAAAAQAG